MVYRGSGGQISGVWRGLTDYYIVRVVNALVSRARKRETIAELNAVSCSHSFIHLVSHKSTLTWKDLCICIYIYTYLYVCNACLHVCFVFVSFIFVCNFLLRCHMRWTLFLLSVPLCTNASLSHPHIIGFEWVAIWIKWYLLFVWQLWNLWCWYIGRGILRTKLYFV